MVGSAALYTPRGLPELRERPFGSAQQLVEARQRLSSLEPGLHGRSLIRETRFLAFLRSERLDLLARMLEIFAVALRGFHLRSRLLDLGLDPNHLVPRLGHLSGVQPA